MGAAPIGIPVAPESSTRKAVAEDSRPVPEPSSDSGGASRHPERTGLLSLRTFKQCFKRRGRTRVSTTGPVRAGWVRDLYAVSVFVPEADAAGGVDARDGGVSSS